MVSVLSIEQEDEGLVRLVISAAASAVKSLSLFITTDAENSQLEDMKMARLGRYILAVI